MVATSSFNSSSYADEESASRILNCWRIHGPDAALSQLHSETSKGFDGLLISEIHLRLLGDFSPRLLIDGLWFCQGIYGGISRVWHQILRTFSLPGMLTSRSSVLFLDRSGIDLSFFTVPTLSVQYVDPFSYPCVSKLSYQNKSLVESCSADVFCSTWISSTGDTTPTCPEVALIHDCIPERYTPINPLVISLRERLISGSKSSISVSSDTAHDLNTFYSLSNNHQAWCYPAPASLLRSDLLSPASCNKYSHILSSIGLSSSFIMLPGSGLIGSYKNPEIVAQALMHSSLHHLDLLITGVNSLNVSNSIISEYPQLDGRVFSAGFSDFELSLMYNRATAVVMSSLVEGFGLPVIEVLQSGGFPVISNTLGLREAGSEAVLRFDPLDVSQLISLLELLSDLESRAWILSKLRLRSQRRLSRLNPDLLGLCLLAQSRVSYHS